MTLGVWKIKELVDMNQKEKSGQLKGIMPLCEYIIGKTQVHTLYFDYHLSDYNNLNLVMGAEKGLKFFTVKI